LGDRTRSPLSGRLGVAGRVVTKCAAEVRRKAILRWMTERKRSFSQSPLSYRFN
jgi:hypothetical protein